MERKPSNAPSGAPTQPTGGSATLGSPAKVAATRQPQPHLVMPKRPLSAYNLFFKETHERIKRQVAAGGDVVPDDYTSNLEAALQRTGPKKAKTAAFQATATTIAARWQALPADKRSVYEELADAEMERYRDAKYEYQRQQCRLQAWQEQQQKQQEAEQGKPPAMAPSSLRAPVQQPQIPLEQAAAVGLLSDSARTTLPSDSEDSLRSGTIGMQYASSRRASDPLLGRLAARDPYFSYQGQYASGGRPSLLRHERAQQYPASAGAAAAFFPLPPPYSTTAVAQQEDDERLRRRLQASRQQPAVGGGSLDSATGALPSTGGLVYSDSTQQQQARLMEREQRISSLLEMQRLANAREQQRRLSLLQGSRAAAVYPPSAPLSPSTLASRHEQGVRASQSPHYALDAYAATAAQSHEQDRAALRRQAIDYLLSSSSSSGLQGTTGAGVAAAASLPLSPSRRTISPSERQHASLLVPSGMGSMDLTGMSTLDRRPSVLVQGAASAATPPPVGLRRDSLCLGAGSGGGGPMETGLPSTTGAADTAAERALQSLRLAQAEYERAAARLEYERAKELAFQAGLQRGIQWRQGDSRSSSVGGATDNVAGSTGHFLPLQRPATDEQQEEPLDERKQPS